MDKLEEYLKTETNEYIKEYLKNQKEENYIDFKFKVEEYDKLEEILEPIFLDQDMIDRKNIMDVITIYETSIENIYFIRMEQYGYADEDAVVYRVCYTKEIKKQIEKSKEHMKNNDFIKMRNNT